MPSTAPASTDPRVAAGVVAWLLDVGAERVTVAEESSISTHVGRGSSTAEAMEHAGYAALIESFESPRVRLASLRDEGTVAKAIGEGLCLREVADYPRLLAEADRLISEITFLAPMRLASIEDRMLASSSLVRAQ